jgi:hypothetical protein
MNAEGNSGPGQFHPVYDTVPCVNEDDGPPDDSGEWLFVICDTFSIEGPKHFWTKRKPKLVWTPAETSHRCGTDP